MVVCLQNNSTAENNQIAYKISDKMTAYDIPKMTEQVLKEYEPVFLRNILKQRGYSPFVVSKICALTDELDDDSKVGINARKQMIMQSFREYFHKEPKGSFQGILFFRMKKYNQMLELLADCLLVKYRENKEYDDFIALLRYFICIQQERPLQCFLVMQPNGSYILLDKNKQDITGDCVGQFVSDVALTEREYDDLLISILITLAPQTLVICHQQYMKNRELFQTITRVFDQIILEE